MNRQFLNGRFLVSVNCPFASRIDNSPVHSYVSLILSSKCPSIHQNQFYSFYVELPIKTFLMDFCNQLLYQFPKKNGNKLIGK